MNKKNLAMAMAAITVVGSAAPVFAASGTTGYTVTQDKYKKVVKDLQEGLTDGTIASISVEFNGKPLSNVTDKDALYSLVNDKLKDMESGDYMDFAITTNNSSQTISGVELGVLSNSITSASVAIPVASAAGADATPGLVEEDTVATTAKPASSPSNLSAFYNFSGATLNGDTLTVPVSDSAPTDLKYGIAGVDKMASAVTLKVKPLVLKANSSKKIDTDKFVVDKDGYVSFAPVSGTSTESINVRVIKATEKIITVGSDSSDDAKKLASDYVFAKADLANALTAIKEENVPKVDGDYQIVLYPQGKRLQSKSTYGDGNLVGELANPDAPAKIVLNASKLVNLKSFVEDLQTYNANNGGNAAVSGSDRIETAIAISQKYYNSTDETAILKSEKANNVVLVGANSIVDGLVASPLAAKEKAPLLLTSKDKLDASVKAEIKRAMGLTSSTPITNTKTIYIAGGENSVSKDVEKELKDMGLKVTRLSGDDRYETSLEIADEIGLDEKAFVVGGTGLADAMSIAPVASHVNDGDTTPIIVVDGKAKELTADQKDFLGDADVDIIGGVNSVSKDMEKAIEDFTDNTPSRVKGDDRQATNAEVIKKYFEKSTSSNSLTGSNGVENFFVAKDGSTKEDQLVDALAVAAVAGNAKNTDGDSSAAPIILATDNLSSEQSVAISKVTKDPVSTLVQVGGGIADSVMNKVKDLLGLK